MIYLTNGNMPLNAAYADEIVQEENNTYQLSFRFPTSDLLWEQLKEETFLTADDLHGEQDFYIFEVEKQQGYIQVYANQVFSLLNNYVVSAINLDRETGTSALSRFAGSITRQHPFSFFSDIWDRHSFNIDSKNAMEAFAKDKHSILGQWGGDLVRHGYQVRLLKNGGSENESLFMYKKNLSSYQHKTSTKSLRTRITFKTTIKGEEEKTPDKHYSVTIESPLINKYNQIYEDVVEVNDQDVKDEASLRKYGEQYFRTTLCDMLEDSLEIEVVGQSDVPVQMFDVVSIYHEGFGLDVRKKITKYTYSPMAKKLKSIGFGQFKSGLANAIGNMVSDALKNETQGLLGSVDAKISKELKNADLVFDRKKEELVNQFTDELNAAKAKAEEDRRQISSEIDKKFQSFDNAAINEARRKAEEALRQSGANALLVQEAKKISDQAKSEIDNLRTSSQTAIEQIEAFKTQYGTKLNEFKSTSDGILTKLGAIETYVNNDGQRQEELKRYARTESASQVSAVREQISRDYVGKSAYQEDVRGLERRFIAISTQTNNDIASKIAQYKQTVDGQFASITSQIAGKANQTDFQRVRETSQLYERIIGSNENDIADKVARMALTNQLFQVEVSKAAKGGRNYIRGIKEMRIDSGSWDSGTFRSSGSGSVRTIDVLDSPVPGFNKAVRIISSDPKGIVGIAQDEFEIMSGIYTMSAWVKGSAGQRVRIQNYWAPDDSTGISPGFVLKDDKWTYLTFTSERNKNGKLSIGYIYLLNGEKGSYIDVLAPQLEEGSVATSVRPALEDTDEAVRTVQSQLAGSWSVQNINSAGDIISGVNLGADGRNRFIGKTFHITGETLIDKAVIKSAMVDKLKTANFEAGSVTSTIIDAEAVTADKVRMDQAFANKLVASNIFTDTLAAKEAFINKLRAVVVSATLLEGYKGRIGGFQLGDHDSGAGKWLTGKNQFSVGMGNGEGGPKSTALWVNWGNRWDKIGDRAWLVKNDGRMWCYNTAEFWNTPVIHGNLRVTGSIYYDNRSSGGKAGYWISSPKYSHIEPSGDSLYLYYSGSGYDWIYLGKKDVSDRRYKTNISDSTVSGLDVINSLKTYSYRKEYDGKTTDISCGIMAQDVQKYAPEAFWKNPDGVYSYKVFELVPYLIKAIQELNQKLEEIA